jgi:ABC-type transport system involved in cytochrome bd biosynthesis fused ATPase/permease subunit
MGISMRVDQPTVSTEEVKAPTTQKAESDCVFEAIGLKKEYDEGQVKALRGVDFRINQGEFVAIVGKSGSGNPRCCKC